MLEQTLFDIKQTNPWLYTNQGAILDTTGLIYRTQTEKLLQETWDKIWLVLTGPRQTGKTTLGKYLSQELINRKRFTTLLYLNCDYLSIRQWLLNPSFVQEAIDQFKLEKFILFIDEVQRVENPGLLLKTIVDLQLPIKLIASGSSQLEIKSKVQEYLTGRHLEVVVLPCSTFEANDKPVYARIIYGCYPAILNSNEKIILLNQLYNDYIAKDIIEILKVSKPDIMRKLVTLIAHASGQLVNYNQLAIDCGVSIATLQSYLAILEKTYVIKAIRPFVGNKRTEVTSNPKYFFLDNGFRNCSLNNFSAIENRTDNGLLVENFIFQEIYKLQTQLFIDFTIHYWRTKSGAEVDFVLYKNQENFIPIEVKFRTMRQAGITRGYRSFLTAYKPKLGVVVTKNYIGKSVFENCEIHFITLNRLLDFIQLLLKYL